MNAVENEAVSAPHNAKRGYPLILALDITGAPHSWLTWQSAVTHTVGNQVHRLVGETVYAVHGGESRATGKRSSVTICSIMALRGRHPRAWAQCAPALSNELLFSRDRNLCCYCGLQKPACQLSRDHISPLGRGGANSWMNVVTACRLTPPEALLVRGSASRTSINYWDVVTARTSVSNQFKSRVH